MLRKALVVAVDWEHIDSVPRIKQLKTETPGFRWLDFDEAEALLETADDWHCMILTALRTGMRFGELRGLHWHDVDLRRGHLTVQHNLVRGRMGPPKGRRSRTLPLAADVLAALKSHRRVTRLRGDLVFSADDGSPLGEWLCQRRLQRACRLANLEPIGWHVLRHTFASHLAMRGVPLNTVRELMGHKSIAMTLRYAHLGTSPLRGSS